MSSVANPNNTNSAQSIAPWTCRGQYVVKESKDEIDLAYDDECLLTIAQNIRGVLSEVTYKVRDDENGLEFLHKKKWIPLGIEADSTVAVDDFVRENAQQVIVTIAKILYPGYPIEEAGPITREELAYRESKLPPVESMLEEDIHLATMTEEDVKVREVRPDIFHITAIKTTPLDARCLGAILIHKENRFGYANFKLLDDRILHGSSWEEGERYLLERDRVGKQVVVPTGYKKYCILTLMSDKSIKEEEVYPHSVKGKMKFIYVDYTKIYLLPETFKKAAELPAGAYIQAHFKKFLAELSRLKSAPIGSPSQAHSAQSSSSSSSTS